MAERGGQPGNDNATRNKPWRAALDRAIAQDDSKRLRASAEELLNLAAAGESWAVQMLADRLDGKVPQAITGEDGGPLTVQILKFSDAVDGS
jgi:hypothetical protein